MCLWHHQQLAKTVMRRDLALWRDKTGRPSPQDVVGDSTNDTEARPNPTELPTASATEEVVMPERESAEPGVPDPALIGSLGQLNDRESVEVSRTEGSPKAGSKPPHAAEVVPDLPKEEGKPSDPASQIDTDKDQQTAQLDEITRVDDDNPPDTGTFSNNADLDSLFNDDPASGSGGDAVANEFSLDANPTTEFDFETFTANLDSNGTDNDNISALLPGLQDYANTHPVGSGQPDFDALFATDVPVVGDGQGEGAGDQQGSGEQHDSTFDDLMDFTDFNAGDYSGNGEDGAGNNDEFNFAFD